MINGSFFRKNNFTIKKRKKKMGNGITVPEHIRDLCSTSELEHVEQVFAKIAAEGSYRGKTFKKKTFVKQNLIVPLPLLFLPLFIIIIFIYYLF